ncbi:MULTISPECIES: cytochrome c biogenesis CcdA family protein [unclassified Paenibacillus]|uniref:cytochrome c biogenesis CcdA family protein n=1 Tax=unclassified Paenibacillus TaxID=185978 RepID=UPI002F3F8BEC
MADITIWLALGAGFASFISPCVLPLYPSYLSYITGISVTEIKDNQLPAQKRMITMTHTLVFLIGFSTVYYALGYGANVFADFFSEYDKLIRQLSSILIVLMGLFLLGIFQPKMLLKERRMNLIPKKVNYVSSFVFGLGFSAGWTPCTGPALTAILGLAASSPGTWFQLTTAYAAGFSIPFFILAFFIGPSRWILKYSSTVMKVGGGLMILMGILLFTDQMTKITIWLNLITPEWLKF